MDLSELYRDIIGTSPDGIWVIDLEGRTLYANPEIARIHRIAEEDLPALTVFDTLDAAGQLEFAAHLDDVRECRVKLSEVEVQWVRSDGDIVWMQVRETALLDDDGRPWAMLHQHTDSTERRLLIESLRLARDEAMEASQQKSEFLATMSHEIRTPLNGVVGLNDLLLRTALSPEQQRLAAGVQVASRVLLGLINDVLDFSKIEAGRMELEELDFEIRPLLEQAAGMLTEHARNKGLDLVVSCHPDVPAALSGDPTRLAQVVANLISNAVKFTEQGSVMVRATAFSADDDRVGLRIEVSDTGVGVPEAQLGHLFEPFTQADSSTTRVYGGTGLGLAISREIVEAMGGLLEFTARLGGGSTFAFTALLDHAVEDGSGDRSGTADDARARDLLIGRSALVVVASDTERLNLSEQLAWWGMAADPVSSAAEAMRLLEGGERYDVVLLDLAMPEQDGLDLARQVRADRGLAGVRLLMLTSVATLDLEVVRDAGVDELLSKPVMSSVLRAALLHLLVGEPLTAVADDPRHGRPAVKGRILVVEDNPVNQLVATGLLDALGYTSDTAADGLAAVVAVRDGDFDAVLMDVQMPRMDGYTATRHIRAMDTGSRLPIIAMTAAVVEGERERCLAAGMDDYLTKPVDPAQVAKTLERWLHPGASYADRLDVDRLAELRELDDPGDERSYVDRAINNFLTGARADLATLTAAAANGRTDELRAVAHRLTGAALNLGAVALGEAAREVEELTTSGAPEDVAATLPRLAELMTADLDALRAYQREQFPVRAS